MRDGQNHDRKPPLLLHPDVPDAAKRDMEILTKAAVSMDVALARLPRTLAWSQQPAVLFSVARTDRQMPITCRQI
jgi:hypothetical protein